MYAAQLGTIESIVTAINDWHTQAAGGSIALTQVNLRLMDGSSVTFVWDEEKTDWEVST